MAQTFHLEIVTPDKAFYEGEVEMVVARTLQGDVAYMADHMWTVSPLATGVLKIKENDTMKEASCTGGFIHVKEGKTTIVTDAAEWPEEIDLERALEAKERAESKIDSDDPSVDVDRAKAAMMRALNRINVKEEYMD